jgi:hypothetical protein
MIWVFKHNLIVRLGKRVYILFCEGKLEEVNAHVLEFEPSLVVVQVQTHSFAGRMICSD